MRNASLSRMPMTIAWALSHSRRLRQASARRWSGLIVIFGSSRVTGNLPTRRLAALARRRSPTRHGLGWKRHRILQTMTHPTLQILILLKARGSDIHKALHRSSGEVHWASVRLPDQIFISLRPDPNHQVVLDDADGHVPSNYEGNAAEHLLLGDVAAVAKNSADTLCQSFVVGQCERGSYVGNL